jgi:N4-(beta-N-acetylglucosaminyl)-L-asparaginase
MLRIEPGTILSMSNKMTRRGFVAAGVSALAGHAVLGEVQAPQVLTHRSIKPLVISAANGNRSKDKDGKTAVVKGFEMITSGSDVLDAIIAGVNIVELDPDETSVGYGGLPNSDGIVQLDASVMHGPLKRGGAVGCLEGVKTPSRVAQKVMQDTDHVLLVGKGAQDFARNIGFTIEDDLNTPNSRRLWLEWKRRTDPEHYLDPRRRSDAGHRAAASMMRDGLIDPLHYFGTITCNAINPKCEICGVTTTSGLAFKIPGRVGDSPILGAGLYVDGEVGAVGSTGRGESNLLSLACFLIVELMRNGLSPKDAGMAAMKRIVAQTIEKRLLNHHGKPNFDLQYYILNARGEHAGVSLYQNVGKTPVRYAVCTENGPETPRVEALFEGASGD